MPPFDTKSEAYRRVQEQEQELETARYIRDLINKSDDTRALWKMIKAVSQTGEARVLGDMGEGRHADGSGFMEKDFWICVGEVRGIRSIPSAVQRMMDKADRADEEEGEQKEE